MVLLYANGRVAGSVTIGGGIDLFLAVLFLLAFRATSHNTGDEAPR